MPIAMTESVIREVLILATGCFLIIVLAVELINYFTP
jgi:hypothetical protein